MSTLVAISALGFISLLLEIFNLRKILVPVVLVGLLAALGITASEYMTGNLLIGNDGYNMIVSTGFSQGFTMLFIILALFVIGMSPAFYKEKTEKIADYVSLKIFLLAGAISMVSFGHLVMFFLGLEVLSVAAYILAASEPKNIRSNEAGMKYFLMGAFASGFIVFGIALMYGAVGSFDVSVIESSLRLATGSSISYLAYGTLLDVGFVMVLVGLLFKASLFPFHFWAPDVYDGSPDLVTATMSTLIKVAAIAALCKIFVIFIPSTPPSLEIVLVAIAMLSMTVANITALIQKNIKRMMAYSGVSHAGFMLMALLRDGGPSNSVLYYAAAYSLAAMAAFAVIIAVNKQKGGESISNFDGLAKSNPLMTVVLSLALLSLAGIPILGGFFAKLFMFNDMLQSGHLILVIVAVVNSIISLYYYFAVINAMFIKKDTDSKPVIAMEYKLVAICAIVLNILLGLFPGLIMGMSL